MKDSTVRAILRLDAAFIALIGTVLLLAPSTSFHKALDLPVANPAIYTQLAGGMFLAFALLLWEAPTDPVLERHVGRAAAIAQFLAVVILPLWLLSGELDNGTQGKVILWIVTVVLAGFAAAETRYLRQ
jgi:hypothetical protein